MIQEYNFKLNNVNYLLTKTTQYKTVTGVVSFVRPLKKEDFTYYTLLNRLIGSSSKKYNTKKVLSNKMFELYDCSVYMSTNYAYKTANSFFIFQTVNGKLVNDNELVKKCIDLLKEIMFNPLVDENGFDEKNFNEEKRSLENDIKNIYNSKKKYSFRKLMEAMAPNDIISCSNLGDLDVLKNITPKSLFDFYNSILNDSLCHVGIIGDIEKEEVCEYFKDFPLPNKSFELEFYPKIIEYKDKVLEVFEKQDIVQAKLLMGFRFDVDFDNQYYVPLLLFNAMFGGMFGSTLFTIVREKYSLAYDISSELLINKKVLIVSGGVDAKNCQLASDLIIKELEKYREGNIEEKLLVVAKEFIVNDLKEMEDSQFSSLVYKLEKMINNRPSVNDIITRVNSVTMEEVIKVSQMIKLDTIFTLLPGEYDE